MNIKGASFFVILYVIQSNMVTLVHENLKIIYTVTTQESTLATKVI